MNNNFMMNLSSWDYANLTKSAAIHGGPDKFVNAIFNAGLAEDVARSKLLGVIVGVSVGVIVGIAVSEISLKWLSSNRIIKIFKQILQEEIGINKNSGFESGANL